MINKNLKNISIDDSLLYYADTILNHDIKKLTDKNFMYFLVAIFNLEILIPSFHSKRNDFQII
jgi:hypothetical protein